MIKMKNILTENMRRFGTKNLNEQTVNVPTEPTPIGKNVIKLQLWKPAPDGDLGKFAFNIDIPVDSIISVPAGIKFNITHKIHAEQEKFYGSYKCHSNEIIMSSDNIKPTTYKLTPEGVKAINLYSKCGEYADRGNTDTPDMA